MKFNLYIPSKVELENWERHAEADNRSLSQFIRLAVNEKVRKLEEKQ